jgi:hypothetical protein
MSPGSKLRDEHTAGGSSSERERFVEDVGIYIENEGLPRMAGRIMGWLLICDPPRQTAAQLASALRASRGSISTMTQLLIRFGLIERVGVPGERQDFFQMKAGAAAYRLDDGVRRTQAFHYILDRGLPLVADQPPESQERLLEFLDLCLFIEREWPSLIDRWQRERAERRSEPEPAP